MTLAPADNGYWLGYAVAAIVLANGTTYLTKYVPYRRRHGRDPGASTAAIVAYFAFPLSCVAGMSFMLGSRLLP